MNDIFAIVSLTSIIGVAVGIFISRSPLLAIAIASFIQTLLMLAISLFVPPRFYGMILLLSTPYFKFVSTYKKELGILLAKHSTFLGKIWALILHERALLITLIGAIAFVVVLVEKYEIWKSKLDYTILLFFLQLAIGFYISIWVSVLFISLYQKS